MTDKDDIGPVDLARMRNWAQSKIDTNQEPPWAWYQYMKLIETLDAILASKRSVKPNFVEPM